jgi:hypothetical protein
VKGSGVDQCPRDTAGAERVGGKWVEKKPNTKSEEDENGIVSIKGMLRTDDSQLGRRQ